MQREAGYGKQTAPISGPVLAARAGETLKTNGAVSCASVLVSRSSSRTFCPASLHYIYGSLCSAVDLRSGFAGTPAGLTWNAKAVWWSW